MIGLRTKIVRHTIPFVPSRWLAAALVAAVAWIAVSVGTADDRQTVTGVVADAQGLGVAELTVSVFPAEPADRTAQPLATTSSDAQGRFTISLPAEAPLLVELQGDRGRGRVRVTPDELGQPLELVYPVRTTVILLHDNDMHFNFNHREAFAAKVEQAALSSGRGGNDHDTLGWAVSKDTPRRPRRRCGVVVRPCGQVRRISGID